MKLELKGAGERGAPERASTGDRREPPDRRNEANGLAADSSSEVVPGSTRIEAEWRVPACHGPMNQNENLNWNLIQKNQDESE